MDEKAKNDLRLELYRSAHFVIDKRSGDVVLCLRRTALPADASVAEQETEWINRALVGVDRSRHAVLFDIRAAPMNSDPSFEAAARKFREEVFRGFVAVYLLTSTATGKLQSNRHAREEGTTMGAIESEEEALLRLREAVAAARPRRTGSKP